MYIYKYLDLIASSSRGIFDVKITLDFVADLNQATAQDVIELDRLGIAKAIRNGKASRISANNEKVSVDLHIRIGSEGREVQENQSGLGNEVFNLLTT